MNDYIIEDVLKKFSNIPQNDFLELINVIEQSKSFVNHFTDTQPTNEFEINYAYYIAKNNKEFISQYKKIVEEACFREFLEWYEYIVKNILREDVQEVLGIAFSPSNPNWPEEVRKSEIFGWAFQVKDTQAFLENIYQVQKLGDIMVNFFNSRKPLSTLDDDYFESDHAQLVLDSIDKIIIKEQYEEMLDHLSSDKVTCMIEVYGWDNRFNHILLNWICENRERIKKWI